MLYTIFLLGMQELGTDVNLYALVFGESVLNDAVCVYPHSLYAFLCSSRAVNVHICKELNHYFLFPLFNLVVASLKMAISLYRFAPNV